MDWPSGFSAGGEPGEENDPGPIAAVPHPCRQPLGSGEGESRGRVTRAGERRPALQQRRTPPVLY